MSKKFLLIGVGVVVIFVMLLVLVGGLAYLLGDTSFSGNAQVAHITLSGVITTAGSSDIFSQDAYASSERIVAKLQQANDDPSVKAIIIQINSPGGSGVASDEISQAIQSIDKPVVSYIRDVGASGAYWVASSTDYIYANRLSTVGSIGVIASYLDFSKFIEDHNISYQRFVAGENKDFGSPFREVTPEQEERFQEQLDQLHTIFISEVAKGRGLDVSYVTQYADGSFYTGMEAKDLRLIDDFGGKNEAIAYIEELLETDVVLVEYEDELSFLEVFAGYIASIPHLIGQGIGSSLQGQFIRT